MHILPYPPHWVAIDEAYTTPAPASSSRMGTRLGPFYLNPSNRARLSYPDTEPTLMDSITE